MNHDTESLVKRDLAGLDALLEQMLPDGDRVTLDPKRAVQAATMVGTVVLAKQVLGHLRGLLNGNGHANGKASFDSSRGRGSQRGHKPGTLQTLILQRLNGTPLKKNLLVRHCCVKGGYKDPSVYVLLKRLEKAGVIKATPLGLVKVKG